MITEDFSLGIEQAQAQIASLGASIDQVFAQAAQQLATNLADAVQGVGGSIELTPTIAAPDTTDVTSAIDTAVSAADTNVTVEADTSGITTAVDEAVASADTTVAVDAEVNTDQAQQSVQSLGEQVHKTSGGFDDLGAHAERFVGIAALASGSAGGLERALARSSTGVVAAGAAIGGLVEVTRHFVDQALEDVTATERFNRSLGAMADRVNSLQDIAGLNESIDQLTLKLGSSDEGVRNAVASLALLGQQAGATPKQIALTSEQLVALAARAVALNPALGSVGDVLDRLPIALSRGGRFAAQYGININQAAIAQEAMAETGKTNTAELTLYEKVAAGATLVTKQLGGSLTTDIQQGSQQAVFGFRQVTEELRRTEEELGKPLLAPSLDFLHAAQPDLEALAKTFGTLAASAIPIGTTVLNVATPALQGLGHAAQGILTVAQPLLSLLDAIPGPVLQIAAGAFALSKTLDVLGAVFARLPLYGVAAGFAQVGVGGSLASAGVRVAGLALQALPLVATAVGLEVLVSRLNASTQAASDLANRTKAAAGPDIKAQIKALNDELERQQRIAGRGVNLGHIIFSDESAAHANDRVKALNRAIADLQAQLKGQQEADKQAAQAEELHAQSVANLGNEVGSLQGKLAGGALTLDQLAAAVQATGVAAQGSAVSAAGFAQMWTDALDKVTADLQAKIPDLASAVAQAEQLSAQTTQGDTQAQRATQEAQRRQDTIDNANATLHTSLAQAAQQTAADLFAYDQAVQAGFDKIAQSMRSAIPSVSDALGQLGTHVSLTRVTTNLTRETKKIQDFFAEVQALASAGLNQTAQLLLQEGPAAAGGLASALARAAPEQRAAFENAVGQFSQVSDAAGNQIDDLVHRLPEGIAAATDAASQQFQQHFHIAAPAGLELDGLHAAFTHHLDEIEAEAAAKAQKVADDVTLRNQDLTPSPSLAETKKALTLDDVIAQLTTQTADLKAFYDEVTRLTNEGFTSAAQVLIEQGPVAGGKLATLLETGGTDAERAFNTTADNYQTAVDKAQGIITASTPQLAGETAKVATAISSALQSNLHLDKATADQIAAMIVALEDPNAHTKAAAAAGALGKTTGGALGQATVEEWCAKLKASGLDRLYPDLCPGATAQPLPGPTILVPNAPPQAPQAQPPPPVAPQPPPQGPTTLIPAPSVGSGSLASGPSRPESDRSELSVTNNTFVITSTEPAVAADEVIRKQRSEQYRSAKF